MYFYLLSIKIIDHLKNQVVFAFVYLLTGLAIGFAGGYFYTTNSVLLEKQKADPYSIDKKSAPKKSTVKKQIPKGNNASTNEVQAIVDSTDDLSIDKIISTVDSLTNDKQNIESTDSLNKEDSTIKSIPQQIGNEIIVREQILQLKKSIKLIDATEEFDTLKIDSTLNKVLSKQSDIKESSTVISLEFWETPLSTKGYTMNNRVLRVYGLEPDEDSKLFELDKRRYLQHIDGFYIIEESYEMKPLMKEERTFIINQLIEFGH